MLDRLKVLRRYWAKHTKIVLVVHPGQIAVIALLVTGNFLSALLPQNVRREVAQNERKLVKSHWRNAPVQVNTIKLKGRTIEFGQAFTDADDDWLKGFSLNVTNTSNKDIVFVDVSLTLFGEEEKLMPGRTGLGYPVSYGSSDGTFESLNKARPISPKESVDINLTDEHYDQLKALLLRNDYPIRFQHMDVRVDTVVFADGILWVKGSYFRRDPLNPEKFIRDKSIQ